MQSPLSQPIVRITIIALAALIIISLFLTSFPQFGQALQKNTGPASPNELLSNAAENSKSDSKPSNSLPSDSTSPELVYWTEQSGNQTILKGVFSKGAYFTRIADKQKIYKNQTIEAGKIITQKTNELATVVPNEYLVKLPGPSIAEKQKQLENAKASPKEIAETLQSYEQELETQQNQARQSITQTGAKIKNSYRVVFNGFNAEIPKEQLESVKQNRLISGVIPNYIFHTNLMDSVPLIHANEVWQIDAQGNDCTALAPIPINPNTDSIPPPKPNNPGPCITGQGIKIGIIDTGVDYTHPDLGGCFGTGCKVVDGYDFVNYDNDPMDDMGHGTHVAATAAGKGILNGVAPDATLYSYKVCDSYGSCYYSAIISGIEYSADPNQDGDTSDHLDVINLSIDGYGNPDDNLSRASDNAVNAGVVAAIAAGNFGAQQTIGSPGTSRNAITVGAVDKQKNMAYFSSRGPVIWTNGNETLSLVKPDIVAPGVAICAAQWDDAWSSNECLDTEHTAISGTSMATPHVAGLAALVKQAHPNWSPLQVKTVIKKTAELLPASEKITTQGTGLVNALQAVLTQNALGVQLDPILQQLQTIPITGRITETGFQEYQIAYTPDKPLNEILETDWIPIISSTTLGPNGRFEYNFDDTNLSDGEYLFRVQALNTQGNKFWDYGYLKLERFKAIEPVPGDIINPKNDLIIRFSNEYNVPIDNFLVQYRLNGGEWTSAGITNTGSLEASLAANSINQSGNLEIQATISHNNGPQSTIGISMLWMDSTLRLNWPIHIPFESGQYFDYWVGILEPAIGNVDSDSQEETVVFVGGNPPKLKIFNADGTLENMIPVGTNEVAGMNLHHPLLVDLDNDGQDEIIAYNWNYGEYVNGYPPYSKLFAFNGDGTMVSGFPVTLSGDLHVVVMSADLDRDGTPEIIVKGNDAWEAEKMTVLSSVGTILSQWDLPDSTIRGSIDGIPAVGNFDLDADLEIAVGTSGLLWDGENWINDGKLIVYNRDGSIVSGWPVSLPGHPLSSPVVGDIDNDEKQEIVIGLIYNSETFPDTRYGGLYAFNRDGQLLTGWPRQMGWNYFSAPSLFDIEGDQNLEIAASRLGFETRIFNYQGQTLPGWPQYTSWNDYYSSIFVELQSGTASHALLTTAGNWWFGGGGGVYGWNPTGQGLINYPKFTEADAQAPAVIEDLDKDGLAEITASSDSDRNPQTYAGKYRGSLYVWDTNSPFVPENQPWPRFHHDKQLTGCYDCEETQAPPTPTFNATVGGSRPDRGYFAQQTTDLGYIAVGTTQPTDTDVDAWLIKLDSNGTMDWNKTFGGTQYDYAEELVRTDDGGYLLAGYTKSSGAGDFDGWLVKTDSQGNTEWQKTFGGTGDDRFQSIQKTSDGGYIMAGFTKSFGSQGSDLWVVKTDSSGNTCNYSTDGNCIDTNNNTFALRLARNGDNEATQIKTAGDGYIISGYTAQNAVDAWLVKINPQVEGILQWEKTFGTSSASEIAYSVDTTRDRGFVLAGVFGLGSGQGDAWLIKTDSSGDTCNYGSIGYCDGNNNVFAKKFGTSGDNRAYFVQQTPDNGYILTGQKSGNGTDLWLIKTNSLGNMDWNKNYGGTYADYGLSVQTTNDNGYIIAGQKSVTGNNTDFWILKTDSQGNS